MLRYHLNKTIFSCILLLLTIPLTLHYGTAKSLHEYDWYDIAAEGSVVAITYAWLLIILQYRPDGRVTNLLFYGCLLMAFSFTLDFIDEFVSYGSNKQLMTIFEASPAPVGMILLSIGMAGWLAEQKLLYRQLHSRELFLRNHQLIDPLTTLYSAEYLRTILQRELELHHNRGESFCLLVLDINQFKACNKALGAAGADKILKMTGELILSQLRATDVLCRYVGDRFMAVLPHTSLHEARLLGRHIQQQMPRLSLPNLPLSLRTATIEVTAQPLDELLHTACQAVSRSHRHLAPRWQTI